MGTSKFLNIPIYVVLSLIATTHLSCHGFCSPGNEDNRISLSGGTVVITPDKDSIQIGDTLWLNSVIPAKLVERYSNGDSAKINFDGAANVSTQMEFLSLTEKNNNQIGAVDSFAYISGNGSFRSVEQAPHSAKTIFYVDQSSNYKFSLGIVAQKKGIYALYFIDIYQASKKCIFASIEILMNNADSHLHYLRDIYYGGDAISSYDSTHAYCFKVY